MSVSESTSPSVSHDAAKVRAELATNAIRDQNEQEREVADRLNEAQDAQARREARRIPGMGEAVDITV